MFEAYLAGKVIFGRPLLMGFHPWSTNHCNIKKRVVDQIVPGKDAPETFSWMRNALAWLYLMHEVASRRACKKGRGKLQNRVRMS